ncbi:hypothetical protein ACW9HF_14990 [Nocardia gipuzkoensis]
MTIVELFYPLAFGAVGIYIAVSGHRDPAVRDCPFCRGVGCERCGWSGEVDDREVNRQGADR